MDISVLDGVVVFIFGKHDTGVPSKPSIFIGLDIEHDGSAYIKIIHAFRQKVIFGCSKF